MPERNKIGLRLPFGKARPIVVAKIAQNYVRRPRSYLPSGGAHPKIRSLGRDCLGEIDSPFERRTPEISPWSSGSEQDSIAS